MKFGLSEYNKPTPEICQKFGRSLTRATIFISVGSITANYPMFALIVLTIGGIGEFMTNFFSEDKNV